MAQRRVTSVKARRASRRNIGRAQASRVGRKEVRSVGRVNRSRQLFSKPQHGNRAPMTTRVARTRTKMVGAL